MPDLRKAFVDALNEMDDPEIIVVIPDVGFNYLDRPENKFKVINTGVTEQFAATFAANLALQGKKVFYYTMINFALFRPAEMIRNAVVCHNAPLTVIGVKGSEAYRFLGFSHNLLHDEEDKKFCDNIGLENHFPQTEEELRKILFSKEAKPRYIRLI